MSRFSRRRGRTTNTGRGTVAARRGASGLARIISTIARLVAAVIVIAILLVVLDANRSNDIVNALLDAGRFLAGPFKDVFDLSKHKVEVAVNYGIAAAVYLLIAGLIARLLRR